MKPNIINYLDYRSYMADLIAWLRSEEPSVSMRRISDIAGASSPNWAQQVIGKRIKAKPEALKRLADFAGLSSHDTQRFLLLAAFDHAKSLKEKESVLRKILQDRRKTSVYNLENEQYRFFSSWFIPVIRELCTHPDFDGTEEWIAKRVKPSVRTSSIRKALKILFKLGLIKKGETEGKWELTSTSVITPSEVSSVAIKRYHESVIDLSKEAIENFPREERDFRSVTLGLSEERFQKLKKRLEQFWYELMEYASEEGTTERVYQYTMQIFPLSDKLNNSEND